MFSVKINTAKSMFFDRVLINAVDRATIRALSKMGSFVRTSARTSIKKRKKSSAPGEPPKSHTGLLKKFIFFGYDSSRRSVVVGPVRLNRHSGGAAPSVLEYGGTTNIAATKNMPAMRVAIEPRPFMGPALAANQPKFPGLWANSVR